MSIKTHLDSTARFYTEDFLRILFMNRTLGERLRILRLLEEKTMEELSHRSGVSPSYISEIESGKKAPTLHTLSSICSAFHLFVVLGTALPGIVIRDVPIQEYGSHPAEEKT